MSVIALAEDILYASCKVCGGRSANFGKNTVLKKYSVTYLRCQVCGFIQTEEPYWLVESYSSAIAHQDVGIMHRNLANCELTSAVLHLLFPKVDRAVDFGAGHGILVRLMRDRGFNFFWSDLHATNDYARGFESSIGTSYDFLTAFEVLEHFTDPVMGLGQLMDLSKNVFVSTCTVPRPAPSLTEWWYYMPSSGQHISFYTPESLQILAARFGRKLLSAGSYHLFTREEKSPTFYRMATRLRMAKAINLVCKRPSLIESDFLEMTR